MCCRGGSRLRPACTAATERQVLGPRIVLHLWLWRRLLIKPGLPVQFRLRVIWELLCRLHDTLQESWASTCSRYWIYWVVLGIWLRCPVFSKLGMPVQFGLCEARKLLCRLHDDLCQGRAGACSGDHISSLSYRLLPLCLS